MASIETQTWLDLVAGDSAGDLSFVALEVRCIAMKPGEAPSESRVRRRFCQTFSARGLAADPEGP